MERSFLRALTPAVAVWAIAVALPLGAVIARSFGGAWQFSTVWNRTLVTAAQAGLSTVLSFVLGLFLAALIARAVSVRRSWSAWAWPLIQMPSAIPALVVAWAFLSLDQSSAWAFSWKAVIFAQVWFNAPWVAARVLEALDQVPQAEWDAARLMGAGIGNSLRVVVWPRVRPAAWSAVGQVFSWCAMSYTLILILGGGPPGKTLESEIGMGLLKSLLDLD